MTLGAVAGSAAQIGEAPPGAHSPNRKGCGVGAKPRAWSGLKPSWPVSTTVNIQPEVGWPNETIAEQLVLSLKTVRNHVSNICGKLQVADRAQAVIRAREAGLR